MNDLAERLTMFIKDLDYFDYMDSMEIDETDEDMIEKNRQTLRNPLLVRSIIEVLEKVLKDGTLEEDEIEERTHCRDLINELKCLYRDLQDPKRAPHAGKERTMKKEIVFIDDETLTPEEWEAIADEQAEE